MSYDAHGRLQSITDVIGLTSQMACDAAGAISSVTTPYGTTQIVTGQNGYRWWSQITDPLGHTERQEMMHGAPSLSFSLTADQIPSVPNAPRSLSDLEIAGCKWDAAIHFSQPS